MQRITKKFGDKTILPILPEPKIENQQDIDSFHKARREIEEAIIRLSEYEDSGLEPNEVLDLAKAAQSGHEAIINWYKCRTAEKIGDKCKGYQISRWDGEPVEKCKICNSFELYNCIY